MYRCILRVPLPSWPHCCDSLTVWRRVTLCSVLLDGATLPTHRDMDHQHRGPRKQKPGTSSPSLEILAAEDDEEEDEDVEFVCDFKDFGMHVLGEVGGTLVAGTAVRPLLHLLMHPVE